MQGLFGYKFFKFYTRRFLAVTTAAVRNGRRLLHLGLDLQKIVASIYC